MEKIQLDISGCPPRKILCNLAQKIAFSQTAATTKLCKNKAQFELFDQLQAQALIYFQHFKKYSLNCQIHAYSEKTLLFEALTESRFKYYNMVLYQSFIDYFR